MTDLFTVAGQVTCDSFNQSTASGMYSVLKTSETHAQDDEDEDDYLPEEWCPADGGGAAASNIDPGRAHVSETRLESSSRQGPAAGKMAAAADDPEEASSPELSDEQVWEILPPNAQDPLPVCDVRSSGCSAAVPLKSEGTSSGCCRRAGLGSALYS